MLTIIAARQDANSLLPARQRARDPFHQRRLAGSARGDVADANYRSAGFVHVKQSAPIHRATRFHRHAVQAAQRSQRDDGGAIHLAAVTERVGRGSAGSTTVVRERIGLSICVVRSVAPAFWRQTSLARMPISRRLASSEKSSLKTYASWVGASADASGN